VYLKTNDTKAAEILTLNFAVLQVNHYNFSIVQNRSINIKLNSLVFNLNYQP